MGAPMGTYATKAKQTEQSKKVRAKATKGLNALKKDVRDRARAAEDKRLGRKRK